MKEKNNENIFNIDDPIILEQFGKKIRKARNKKKISQGELGELLSITRQAISKWETVKSIPDISIWRKISEVLEIDLSEFVNIVDNSLEDFVDIKKEIEKLDIELDKEKKVVTEDKVLENKEKNNTQKKAVNFYLDKKVLIIIFSLLISTTVFLGTTFFMSFKKNENQEEIEKNEWKQLDLINAEGEISFVGSVTYDNYTSIYNIENFFYNSPIIGTKKEPILKCIELEFYIGKEEIYSYTYNRTATRLQDFLDNVSIAVTHKETFKEENNIVIKLTLIKKDGSNSIVQIEVVPSKN